MTRSLISESEVSPNRLHFGVISVIFQLTQAIAPARQVALSSVRRAGGSKRGAQRQGRGGSSTEVHDRRIADLRPFVPPVRA